jgi:DNA (cytosine-5)-methyltransferase 1
MSAYYNEHDPFAAAWLRELIKAGLITDGEVDERSIELVSADDVRAYTQCHWFAGIGGWSYALRLAGWSDKRVVWTGSCPCQPFSIAGTQAGGNDSRDLWPTWYQLIAECRPPVVFGEQVESAIAHGWLDRVCDDLEAEGYAVGACGLPAASVGAFHIRQRLWFVADTTGRDQRRHGREPRVTTGARGGEAWQANGHTAGGSSAMGELADTEGSNGRLPIQQRRPQQEGAQPLGRCEAGDMADTKTIRLRQGSTNASRRNEGVGPEGSRLRPADDRGGGLAYPGSSGPSQFSGGWQQSTRPAASGFWSATDWLPCADGKARPVEPGTFPLAYGVPARVVRLRGYGNAIVPQVAQAFIESYLDASALNR